MRPTLADAIFWVAVACCALAQLAILRSVFAAHPRPGDGPAMPRVRRGVEAVWAVVPAIGLALVLALTWRAMHPDVSPAPAAAIGSAET